MWVWENLRSAGYYLATCRNRRILYKFYSVQSVAAAAVRLDQSVVKSVYLPTASQSASEWLSQLLGGLTPQPGPGLLSQKVDADRGGPGECGPADK